MERNGQNGKGDGNRVSDTKAYRDNYDAIFGGGEELDSAGRQDDEGRDSGGE